MNGELGRAYRYHYVHYVALPALELVKDRLYAIRLETCSLHDEPRDTLSLALSSAIKSVGEAITYIQAEV